MSAVTTIYDEVEYPGQPRPQVHPRRLYTLGRLLGLAPPPVESARVLELGCGDGMHLLWIAEEFRSARCVGIDLAESGLARGRAAAAEIGLTNVELMRADLLDLDASLGEFDYIIAHGLYSWIPERVREQLMAICGRNLARDGIAVVSYNAYPGCHLRRLADDAMRFHAARHESAAAKLTAAREIAEFLSLAATRDTSYQRVLRDELKLVEGTPAHALFHDDLAETNHPVYLVDFVAHARRHGLQYLCDSALSTGHADGLGPDMQVRVNQFARDRVEREQYVDFVHGRRFRHSLLHRSGREPDFPGAAARAMAMFVAAPLRHDATHEQLIGDAEVTFAGMPLQSITLAHPLLKCALHRIAEAWPEPLAAQKLLTMSREMAGRHAEPEQVDRNVLETMLFEWAAIEIITLLDTPWRATAEPGERPCATALARWQAARGSQLTAHDGTKFDLAEGISRRFVCLLDGTRTADQLADELFRAVNAGEVDVPPPLQEACASGEGRNAIAEGIPFILQMLSRRGLLQRRELPEGSACRVPRDGRT